MTLPDSRFVEAMTRGSGFGGIDFAFLASCTTEYLVNQILIVKESVEAGERGLRKHRAMALMAELSSRPDLQRPRRTDEATAVAWLEEQVRSQ